jgi:AcrR family transcriptional regulator
MTGEGRAVGRPRTFDTDDALEAAMRVFWAQGYEGASLSDLTSAMGISRTSMYAAFGNKEELFGRVLERYTEGPASYGVRAMTEPTAQRVVAAFLNGTVAATTHPDCPAGCLGVQGSLAAGPPAQEIRERLAGWRNWALALLRDRFQRAVDDGDLPPQARADALARYVLAVSNGMAVQAASGASAEDLQGVADAALRSWPPI